MLPSRFKAICLTIVALCIPVSFAAAAPPNILLIVSDDQGYNDLGVLNPDLITPHLDRLAAEGTRLTDFYVAWPACTPSRASLLTGRFPQRNGIYDMIRNEAPDYGYKYKPAEYAVSFERIGGMDQREKLLPEYLQEVGYTSAIFGKWDLGSLQRYLPTNRGFDEFYGFVNTGIDYFTHERYGVPSMFRQTSPTEEDRGEYATELFKREALSFLDRVENSQPFLLYLPFNAPHNSSSLDPRIRSTVQAPEEYKAMYPDVDPEYRTVDRYRYGNPAQVVTREARRRDYRAAITCMDAAIGEVLEKLEENDILDDTIVIFFSDNGGSGGANNSPLRGHKAQVWEGGIRVPCLVRWPNGGVPAGATNDRFLTSLELVPSLVAAAGGTIPEEIVMDGRNWWPALKDGASSPRNEMFWKRRDHEAARVGSYKLVALPGEAPKLYDLSRDIGEKNDLSQTQPQILKRVQTRLKNWHDAMEAAEPRGPFRDF